MLNISLYTPDIMLSSNLDSITIMTDADFVDVVFRADGYPLLSGRYYPLNRQVTVSNLGELVESQLAGNTDTNWAECTIEATAGSEEAEKTFRVMYCSRSVDVFDFSSWLQQNFLTAASFHRVKPTDMLRLVWYTTEKEGISCMVYATFLDPNGKRDVYQYVHSGNGLIAHVNDIMQQYIYIRDVIDRIKSAKKLDAITLQSVTVRVKDRSVTYFVDPSLDSARKFYFVNCFNIVEQLPLVCTTTDKISSDRSVAVIGRGAQFYDVTNSKEYETETGPLTSDECRLIEQMLQSPKVKIQWGFESEVEEDFDAMFEILITDFTCELSDSNTELNKVKFTWQFAETTPKLDIPISPGIFNDKFNPVYS